MLYNRTTDPATGQAPTNLNGCIRRAIASEFAAWEAGGQGGRFLECRRREAVDSFGRISLLRPRDQHNEPLKGAAKRMSKPRVVCCAFLEKWKTLAWSEPSSTVFRIFWSSPSAL